MKMFGNGKLSKLNGRLVAILSCTCLLAVLLAGCGDKGGASHGEKSGEDVKESSSQPIETTESGGTPEGKGQTVTMSTEELFQGFIDGTVRVYCDNQDYTFYDSVADEEYKMFGNKDGYTLKEMTGILQGILDVTPDIIARIGSVYYALIDCGRDGEPELVVEVYNDGELWGTTNQYQFIIKNINGKLQICNMLSETYYDESYINSATGIVLKNYYYGMGSQYGVGYLDADCEYHFLYSDDVQYSYGGSDGNPIIAALAEIAEREGDEGLFDCLDVVQYRFSEYQDDEDEKQVLKCTYYYYGGENYDDEPDDKTKALIEEAFAKAGYALYTEDEINDMIDARLKEFGFPKRDEIYDDYVDWKAVNKEDYWPGEVVTVKDADEFMKAIGSNKIIYLEPGTYDLTKWLQGTGFNGVPQYLSGDYSSENSVGVSYAGYDDSSWEIHVSFVENLTIASKNPDKPAQIVCDCPSALVMEFDQCAFIELRDLVMGHEVEPGFCTGDVVGFDDSNYCTLNHCDLYGCGAYGADFYGCDSMSMQDCVIHDCTYGCMNIVNSGYLYIENCKFENCKEFYMFEIYDTGVNFYNCTFRNLDGELLSQSESAYVSFNNCMFDESALKSIQNHPLYGENVYVY